MASVRVACRPASIQAVQTSSSPGFQCDPIFEEIGKELERVRSQGVLPLILY